MKRKHYTNISIIMVFFVIGLLLQIYIINKPSKTTVKPPKQASPSQKEIEVEKVTQKPEIKEQAILSVPYTVQAPYANWNIHEESCEEAALLMIHYYLTGDQVSTIPPEKANQELVNMVAWQKNNYGREKDLNLYEIGKLAGDYYGYKYHVTEDVMADHIKQEITEGNPVMVPVITHGLSNPHYGSQPTYHILVIKGYNANGVITNDAGVKEGRDYFYTWDILWQAIDAQSRQMNQGRDILVVTK